MKTKTFLLTLMLMMSFGTSYGADVEKILNSKISQVTVFQNAAQVVQTAESSLLSGQTILIVKEISPYIDPQSLQVKGFGKFTVLSVNHLTNYVTQLEETEDINSLRSKIEEIEINIENETTETGILREKESFLMANKLVSGKDQIMEAENFRNVYTFFSTNLEQIRKSIVEKERNLKKLREELTRLQQQISQLQNRGKLPSHEIHISVNAPAQTTAKFEISYMVQAAGWYPSYDIRVDKLNEPVSLVYKANVYQNTGIEWKNVKLSFSNATPNRSGNIPTLFPYYLNFQQYRPVGDNLQKSRKSEAMPIMAIVADNIEMMDDEVLGFSNLNEVVVVRNATGFSFDVAMPYDVKSGGDVKTIEMQRLSLPCEFAHRSVPKLEQEAFLLANIHDWEQYDLLDGEANLYFENTFVGKSLLNLSLVKDTLNLSLGRDQGIVIKREKRKDFKSEKFIGSNRVETRSWEISIRNTKAEAIKITVLDQIPVSGNKEITVEAEELSGGKTDVLKGIVSWDLDIKAGETKTLILTYNVKYPKDKEVFVD